MKAAAWVFVVVLALHAGGLLPVAPFSGGAGLAADAFSLGAGGRGPLVAGAVPVLLVTLALSAGARAAGGARAGGLLMWFVAGALAGADRGAAAVIVAGAVVLTSARLRRGDAWPLIAPAAFALGLATCLALLAIGSRPSSAAAGPRPF